MQHVSLPDLDPTALEELFEDDVRGMVELLDSALENAALWRERWHVALEERDRAALRVAAHALKGSLGNVGAKAAAERARSFECEASGAQWERLIDLTNEFDRALERFVAAVAAVRRRAGA